LPFGADHGQLGQHPITSGLQTTRPELQNRAFKRLNE
jgi:hypothetical protein